MKQFKNFTGRKNAHACVAKSPAQAFRYSTPLEAVTLRDGSKAIRYVPTFKPATDEQRTIIAKAGFRCADEVETVA
jgi:hypothetical protein